jgi:hypothetical protein
MGLLPRVIPHRGDRLSADTTVPEFSKLLTSVGLDDSRRSEKRVSWTQFESKAIVVQHICQECTIFYRQTLNSYDK